MTWQTAGILANSFRDPPTSMPDLRYHIEKARAAITAGRLPNEAAISGSVVRRILDALDWPVYEPAVVTPEYSVEGRRVDFA
ncbi:MAG: hypothetical protein AAF907_17485, partial [Planctomycetota bacterium]